MIRLTIFLFLLSNICIAQVEYVKEFEASLNNKHIINAYVSAKTFSNLYLQYQNEFDSVMSDYYISDIEYYREEMYNARADQLIAPFILTTNNKPVEVDYNVNIYNDIYAIITFVDTKEQYLFRLDNGNLLVRGYNISFDYYYTFVTYNIKTNLFIHRYILK